MLSKKDEKGKCPLNKFKACREDCVLYRKGTRYNEANQSVSPIEICAFNVMADNLETMHQRVFSMEQEIGEMKNVTAFHALAVLGKTDKEKAKRVAESVLQPLIDKNIEEDEKKQLSEK